MSRSIFAQKPIRAFLEAAPPSCGQRLGALDLTLLGVGCIMGTGIFVLTGQIAALHAGPAAVIAFLLAALTAALAAVCYAEMAAMIPVAGSAYVYAYAALGELPAFLIGWIINLQYLVGAAVVAGGWSGYAVALLELCGLKTFSPAWRQAPLAWDPVRQTLIGTGAFCNLPAVLALFTICIVLSRGTRETTRLNTIIVGIKMLVVFLFIGFGLPHVTQAHLTPFLPPATDTFGHFGVSGLLSGATLAFFAYLGFDAVSVAAGETRRPQRDVPLGILASLGICAFLYMAVAFVLVGIVDYRALEVANPMAVGARAIGMTWLESVIELGALAGLTSVLLGQLFAQPRIAQAMARDGFFPQALAKQDAGTGAPTRAICLSGILCALMAGLLPIGTLAEITSVGTLMVFAGVALGVMILRHTRPDLPRKFLVPGGAYLVPSLCIIISGILMSMASRVSFLWLAGYAVVGCALYFGYSRKRVSHILTEQGL